MKQLSLSFEKPRASGAKWRISSNRRFLTTSIRISREFDYLSRGNKIFILLVWVTIHSLVNSVSFLWVLCARTKMIKSICSLTAIVTSHSVGEQIRQMTFYCKFILALFKPTAVIIFRLHWELYGLWNKKKQLPISHPNFKTACQKWSSWIPPIRQRLIYVIGICSSIFLIGKSINVIG